MPKYATRPVLVPLSAVLLVLGGCLGTLPTRFYLLPALTDVSSPAAMGERALTIVVGPVTLPPCVAETPTMSAGAPLRALAERFRAPLFAVDGVLSTLTPEAQARLHSAAKRLAAVF